MQNRFNLVDEPWIPVADQGRVSLKQVFSQPEYRALGGNPVQKLALTKLLLAIAQAACTPDDDDQWQQLGWQGMATQCLAYLEQWHDRFYLYGAQPFLQMPAIEEIVPETGLQPFGAGFYPDVFAANNTMLSQTMMATKLNDAEKAVFLVTLMNFSFGGKRVQKGITTLAGRKLGSHYSAKAGPSIGRTNNGRQNVSGYLHIVPLGDNLQQTLWFNVLSHKQIKEAGVWPRGLGSAPWETMPCTENDEITKSLRESYFSVLIAMSRFVLLKPEGIIYTDGIEYPTHLEGWSEPTLMLGWYESKRRIKFTDPEKRPWRELLSMLEFLRSLDNQSSFECMALTIAHERRRCSDLGLYIWAGGLKVSQNSGDQSVKQSDDFVESIVRLPNSKEMDKWWFSRFQHELSELERVANLLAQCVWNYDQFLSKTTRLKKGQSFKKLPHILQATNLFWQLCERQLQALLNSCDNSPESRAERQLLRRRFAGYLQQTYNQFCPHHSARQLDAWAGCRPNTTRYLTQEVA